MRLQKSPWKCYRLEMIRLDVLLYVVRTCLILFQCCSGIDINLYAISWIRVAFRRASSKVNLSFIFPHVLIRANGILCCCYATYVSHHLGSLLLQIGTWKLSFTSEKFWTLYGLYRPFYFRNFAYSLSFRFQPTVRWQRESLRPVFLGRAGPFKIVAVCFRKVLNEQNKPRSRDKVSFATFSFVRANAKKIDQIGIYRRKW